MSRTQARLTLAVCVAWVILRAYIGGHLKYAYLMLRLLCRQALGRLRIRLLRLHLTIFFRYGVKSPLLRMIGLGHMSIWFIERSDAANASMAKNSTDVAGIADRNSPCTNHAASAARMPLSAAIHASARTHAPTATPTMPVAISQSSGIE